MLEKIYSIGRRNSIIGFIEHSKDQYIAKLSKRNNETEKKRFVSEQHIYLVGVLQQMYNPLIDDSDVSNLNQIADAISRASSLER